MKATRTTSVRLSVQSLEDRAVPASLVINPPILVPHVTATMNYGVLQITGTEQADKILVRQAGGQITVSGVPGLFAVSQIQRIEVSGLGGNDIIRLDSELLGGQPIYKPSILSGGTGNDVIIGGWGNDILLGNAGDDAL